MKKLLLGFLVILGITLSGITIHNESPYELFAATYYFDKQADKVSEVKPIKQGETAPFDRPDFKLKPKRYLVFSTKQEDLKTRLSSSDFHLLPSVAIALGNDFFLDLDKGSLKGYNAAEWRVVLPLRSKLSGVTTALDDALLGQVRKKYAAQLDRLPATASVRTGTALAPEELDFLAKRKPKVKAALEKLLGMKLEDNEVPVITVAGSGGGFRAMLGFFGLLEGLEETELFNTVSAVSGLSGSTWALGPWYSSGWSLAEFKRRLLTKIATDLLDFKPNVSDFAQNYLMRIAFKQPVTPVNAFGRILGYNLLEDLPGGPFGVYLHDQAKALQDGSKPLPIYTAVATKLPYQWVEFTPYEMGGDYFGGYIPMWAFGAPFLNGSMEYKTPPYSLSYVLAICGSAFSARLSQVAEELGKKIPVQGAREALATTTENISIGKFRVASAEVFNWTWGMRPLPRAQQKTIKLIDGGIWYNFGVEALYRRKPQVIIIGDYSDTEKPGDMLRRAEQDLRERGFKVPPISYEGLEKKPYAIFRDPQDLSVPIIIYFPHNTIPQAQLDPQKCGSDWCSTFNFKYPADKAEQLIDLAKQRTLVAFPAIKEAFKEMILARRKK